MVEIKHNYWNVEYIVNFCSYSQRTPHLYSHVAYILNTGSSSV